MNRTYKVLSLLMCWSSFALILSGTIAPETGTGRSSEEPKQASELENVELHRKALDAASSKFLKAISDGDAEPVIALLSKKGVTLGVDVDPTPRMLLKEELRTKTGFYCRFFDTTCLQREDTEQRKAAGEPDRDELLLSFREMLSRSKPQVRIATSKNFGRWYGDVTISFPESKPPIHGLSFEFIYENASWKLVGIPEY